jgi:hypothetical protein
MRSADDDPALVLRAFQSAAQAIESVVRDGRVDAMHGFLSIVAGAAYHLAHLNARAFILMNRELVNLAPTEQLFREIILRRFSVARTLCRRYIASHEQQARAAFESGDIEDVSARALALNYHRAIAALLAYFATGDVSDVEVARTRLSRGVGLSGEWGFAEAWWLCRLTLLMLDDFEKQSYHAVLPDAPDPVGQLRRSFIDHLASRRHAEVDLWPSQVGAARRAFDETDDLVLALPTSAGKTRIADICMIPTLAGGRDVIYVTPLRALSAQVERDVRALFGELGFSVSSLYDVATPGVGDLSIDRIRISTPEKLDFALRKDPSVLDNVGLLVFDEGHLIGTSPREIRYEQLIDRILRVKSDLSMRFVCLSALLPAGDDIATFTKWIRNGNDGSAIRSEWRPTRQTFGRIRWKGDRARLDLEVGDQRPFIEHLIDLKPPIGRQRQKPFPKDDRELLLACVFRLAELGESVLLYCPLKASVKADARELIALVSKGYLRAPLFDSRTFFSAAEIGILKEWLGHNHPVTKCLRLGIAIHHGDLPQAVLTIVERMIHERASRVIIASPSIAQGINVSASTVIFQGLRRYDPRTGYSELIPVEEFRNVVGRAGRAFVDIGGQILYSTGMDPERVANRAEDWGTQRVRASDRRLESGLFGLVIRLLDRLGPVTDESIAFLAAHANVDSSMSREPLDVVGYDEDVDALDDAVLALIKSDDVPIEGIADHLDQILQSSLFARTLANHEARVRTAVRAVVDQRAMSLIARFTPNQRNAAYVSGVRIRLAREFEQLVADISEPVLALEVELSETTRIADVTPLAEICERLLEFPQFKYTGVRNQVSDRRAFITDWLRGRPLCEMIAAEENALPFIEEAVRYLSVWGLDAVRNAIDVPIPDVALTSLLSFGVSSRVAVDLYRSRLDSRAAAMKVAEAIPQGLDSRPLRFAWLADHLDEIRGLLDEDENIAFEAFWKRSAKPEGEVASFIWDLPFMLTDDPPNEDELVFIFPTSEGRFEATDRDLRVFAEGALPDGAAIRVAGEMARIEGDVLVTQRVVWY